MNKKNIVLIITFAFCFGILANNLFTKIRISSNEPKVIEDTEIATDLIANNNSGFKNNSFDKLNGILQILNYYYVDPIDETDLTEKIIPKVLEELDPHSVYISKDDVEDANADLEGSFSGIGVQFNILQDTIMIVDVIAGGPSEKLGLMPGDRIVQVNDTNFTGKEINNNKVVKTLRGKKGTMVKVGVKRNGTAEVLQFNIKRGDIPVNSVDVSYKIQEGIGYIKISRFGAQTYNEFATALNTLKKQGCSDYIIDLRFNSGGYLSAVMLMVNEFLHKNQLIVYTQGRTEYDVNKTYADGQGKFKNARVCVLINEWSASASEIFAGAMQDNDRGYIIGRRSFGKGLVQQRIPLTDGSEMRLTVSRYYTPSGRCIQKPYDHGDSEGYDNDILNRYEHGEFFQQDSIMLNDSLKYKTISGRTVYGGGGIMPDYFIAQDTTATSSKLYKEIINKSLMYKFAFKFTDKNRAKLKQFTNWQDLVKYLDSTNYFNEFIEFVKADIKEVNEKDIETSKADIQNTIKAYISRNILGEDGFYPILNNDDDMVKKAIEVFNNNYSL